MATKTTVADGTWTNAGTWDDGVPGAGDDAVVNHVVSMNANKEVNNVTIEGTDSRLVIWANYSLTVHGEIYISPGSTLGLGSSGSPGGGTYGSIQGDGYNQSLFRSDSAQPTWNNNAWKFYKCSIDIDIETSGLGCKINLTGNPLDTNLVTIGGDMTIASGDTLSILTSAPANYYFEKDLNIYGSFQVANGNIYFNGGGNQQLRHVGNITFEDVLVQNSTNLIMHKELNFTAEHINGSKAGLVVKNGIITGDDLTVEAGSKLTYGVDYLDWRVKPGLDGIPL